MIEVMMHTPPTSSGSAISAVRLAVGVHEQGGQHHGGADGHDIGFEQVGGHAGAVADIVAHVVGDHGRVAGVVLGNSGLDLADEVGADVGGLGEDAAAETGEDGDERLAPKASATSASMTVRSSGARPWMPTST
jgi:hypothetical protein